MAMRSGKNLRYALLAIVISMALWGVAHGGSKTQKEYDLPVVFNGLPDHLVITDQSTSKINVRVQGSRAAFRNAKFGEMEYIENVAGGKPGRARYEVNDQRLDTPRGLQIVGLSPSEMLVRFERRGRKNVKIRSEVEGELPEGYTLVKITIEPQRVWLTGARSNVIRMSEVLTETIDVSSLRESEEREVGLAVSAEHVWVEDDVTVTVKIDVQPPEPTEEEAEAGGKGEEKAG
jgi:YbbR domain-containing protein